MHSLVLYQEVKISLYKTLEIIITPSSLSFSPMPMCPKNKIKKHRMALFKTKTCKQQKYGAGANTPIVTIVKTFLIRILF